MDVVLISPVSPFDPRDGHRMAVLSDVCAVLDNHLELGVIAFTYGAGTDSIAELCPTLRIAAARGGFASRFVRGCFKNFPHSAERLYSSAAHETIRSGLRKWSPKVVIIDDTSVSGYIADVREICPKASIVLRTHNVMHDVRMGQLSRVTGLSRSAIALDARRYVDLERAAVLASDCHWAITESDARRMSELYQRPAECLTVSISFERYGSLAATQGRPNGFVHIGSLDFRRRTDLCQFLDNRWPRILGASSSATLTLAGEMQGKPVKARNVGYMGRVADDVEIYKSARFAFNFQSSPGGVKIKTLTSLAAARTLLSTGEGVEGLAVRPGFEFFDIDHFLERKDLDHMLSDREATKGVAEAGREYVCRHHSRRAVARQFQNMLDRVLVCH